VQSATHKKRDGCWGGLTNPKTGFVEKWGHWDDFARVSLFGRATDSLKAGRLTFYGNARGKSRKSHTVDLGVDLGYWQRMTPPPCMHHPNPDKTANTEIQTQRNG